MSAAKGRAATRGIGADPTRAEAAGGVARPQEGAKPRRPSHASRTELIRQAADLGIAGRSKMSREQLQQAIAEMSGSSAPQGILSRAPKRRSPTAATPFRQAGLRATVTAGAAQRTAR